MPALLRRALAQLKGDPPESWPNIGEGFSSQYPFPMWVQMCAPHLNGSTPRADLIAMLTRLDRAEIGRAWSIFNQRCAAIECDPGGTVLCILTDAVAPVHAMSMAARAEKRRRVSKAARNLLEKIEAIVSAGASLHGLLPPNPAERKAFIVAPRHTSTNAGTPPVRAVRQIRGSKWQRVALYIAHQVAGRAGIPAGVAIANASTGARITAKALTKPRKYPDSRGMHARLRVEELTHQNRAR